MLTIGNNYITLMQSLVLNTSKRIFLITKPLNDFLSSPILQNPVNNVTVIVLFVLLFMLVIRKYHKKRINKTINVDYSDMSFEDIVKEIHYAACYCKGNSTLISKCKELLKKHPEVVDIAMPPHNYTPFLRACWNGCPELITFMIGIGANINATTDAGEGGIYLVTYSIKRHEKTSFTALKILIASGLDINLARHDGYTALHLAASRGQSRLVRWMLAYGANPAPVGKPTASQIAHIHGYDKIADILRLPSFYKK